MVCVEKDKLSYGHIYKLPFQKRCSYKLHVVAGIVLGEKAIPKYR